MGHGCGREAQARWPENKIRRLDEISKELLSKRPDLTRKMRCWPLLHCASFANRDDLVAQILSVAPELVDEIVIVQDIKFTAIDIAINEGHENVVLRILEMCPSKVSSALLQRAVRKGFRAVVKHLLATNPAMVDAVTDEGRTTLHLAAHNGDITVFSLLLAAKPGLIAAITNKGWNVLHIAASMGHVALVELLLINNATLINAVTNPGWTAMHCAVVGKGHLPVIALLHTVSPGLVHVATPEGWNALHFAIPKDQTAVALYLLTEAPELINVATNEGFTPLYLAVNRGLTEVVAHILRVDVTLANTFIYGVTLLHHAVVDGHVAVAEQLLACNPALIDAVTQDGFTVLHGAALKGNTAMVSYLLSVKPALIGAQANASGTALHVVAAGWGLNLKPQAPPEPASLRSTTETLLAMKPDLISMKDNDGNTPLHSLAGKCQSRDFLEHMWRLYPEALRAANKDNLTPFHLAVAWQNGCAIDLFQWVLTWEEIKQAYDECKVSYVERFKPVLETQCEGLLEVLLPEVVETVFEYLGFERVMHRKGEQTILV